MDETRRNLFCGAAILVLAQCTPTSSETRVPLSGRSKASEDVLPFQPDVALLTFDDGPHPGVTPSVLTSLERLNRKAVFFMIGSMVERHPEVARAVVQAGHTVGNHSYSHPALAGRSDAFVRDEIGRAQEAIEAVTGVRPGFFRPPYGSYDATTISVMAEFGLRLVMWDVDVRDYRNPGAAAIARTVQSAPSQSIVLLHDIQPQTAAALKMV